MNTYLSPKTLREGETPATQATQMAKAAGMVPARAVRELLTELRDLAYLLDRRGEPAAADVATSTAQRLQELVDPDQVP
jgi:hypothetical protein